MMYFHSNFDKVSLSFRMYSYVVRHTFHFVVFMILPISFLAYGEPLYSNLLTEGAHLSNSKHQLLRVESGTMMRKGPKFFLVSIK